MQLLLVFPQILIILVHRTLGRGKHYNESREFINKLRCSIASNCSNTINFGLIQPNIKTALNLCFYHLQKSLYIINNQESLHLLYFIIIIIIIIKTIIIVIITTSSINQTYIAKLAIIHALPQLQWCM